MKYQKEGVWTNKNASRAYDKYIKLSTKDFEDMTKREKDRMFKRVLHKK